MTAKLAPAQRRKQILEMAVLQASRLGYQNIQRQELADAAGVAAGTVNLHWGTMGQLKRAVVRHAVAAVVAPYKPEAFGPSVYVLRIVAQALAAGDKQAARVPEDLKRKALETLV